jgi:ankyrin repeat protein
MNSAEQQLHAACEQGDALLCLTLLQQGVNVNAIDSNLATPLIRAVLCNQVDVVNVIMQKCMECDCRVYDFDNQGFAAFHWAIMLGHVDIVSLMSFRDRSLLTRADKSGRSPFYLCSLLRPNKQVR